MNGLHSAITEFLEEFTETYIYHHKDEPKYFNFVEMKKSLDEEIEAQLKAYREKELLMLIYEYDFDEAMACFHIEDLKKAGTIKKLARGVYKKCIVPELVWENMWKQAQQ